jgi:hypothetical protein
MQMATILVAARDCARYLKDTLKNIELIANQFDDNNIVFFENDSRDDTKYLLAQFCDGHAQRELISVDSFAPSLRRTARLAAVRNTLLKRAKQLAHPIVVMMDADDVNATLSIYGFRIALDLLNAGLVDVATANQRLFYYDKFALRSGSEPPRCHDGWALRYQLCTLRDFGFRHSFRVPASEPVVKHLRSAFGGLAIFRLADVGECAYNGDNDCEHIAFNGCMYDKALNVAVVPQMLNSGHDQVIQRILWRSLLAWVVVVVVSRVLWVVLRRRRGC